MQKIKQMYYIFKRCIFKQHRNFLVDNNLKVFRNRYYFEVIELELYTYYAYV